MSFHEVRFPENISYGSKGGPGYKTDIVEVDSGAEERLSRLSTARHRYFPVYGVKSHADMAALKAFYMARQGAAHGFRYKDFHDFTTGEDGQGTPSSLDVVLANLDGTTTQYQLVKYYVSGATVRTRVITKPVANTTVLAINGVELDDGDFTVNTTTGIITLTVPGTAGHSLTGGCEFDVPVRFSSESDGLLDMTYDSYGDASADGVSLIELFSGTAVPEPFDYGGSLTLDPLTSNYTLSLLDGRVIVVNPNAAGRKLILPNPANVPLGGPHFYVVNLSATDSVSIEYPLSTPVVTLAASGTRTLHVAKNGSGTPTWYYT